MPEVAPPTDLLPLGGLSNAPTDNSGAHQRASDYVNRTLSLEGSGKDPHSSAVGGFIDSTWLNLMHQAAPQTQQMPQDQVLALRSDPVLRGKMIAAYAAENAPLLQMAGYKPDEANLRLAHWFGPAGAVRVLKADPGTPVDKIFSPDVVAANPVLQGKTAGQVIDFARQQMAGTTLSQQWHGSISPEAQGLITQMQSDAHANHEQNMAMLAQYGQLASQAPPGSAERQKVIDEMRQSSHKMMLQWENLASHPPVQKPIDMWQNFGSAATIIGLLGGLFARNHLTTALTAAGSAMRAINSNNAEQFQQSYKTWEQETSLGLKMIDLQNQEMRQILDDQKMAVDEKNTRLATLAHEQDLLYKDQTNQAGVQERVLGYLTAADKATNSAKNAMDMIKVQNYGASLTAAKQAWLQKNPDKTVDDIPPDEIAKMQNTAAASSGLISAQSAAIAGGPGSGLLTPEAIDLKAEQALKGDTSARQGLGFGNIGAINRAAIDNRMAELAKQRGVSGQELARLHAEFMGLQAEERAVGTREAAVLTAAQEAKQLVPQVIQTSDKVNRTSYPDLNKIILAGEQKTGDPDVVRFGIAVNSFINTYARALNPSGRPTVSDKDHARELLSTAWSKGQIHAAMDQLQIEINAAITAPAQVRQQIGGKEPQETPPTTSNYSSADDVLKALDRGDLTDAQAKKLLIDKYGYKPQQ